MLIEPSFKYVPNGVNEYWILTHVSLEFASKGPIVHFGFGGQC